MGRSWIRLKFLAPTFRNMAGSDKSENQPPKKTGPTNEQIVAKFQEMRQQQRIIIGKISELEMEKKEHELVLATLTTVPDDRKCFRMVGGVLVERTVSEVTPALTTNTTQITKLIETLQKQLETKGTELNEYREKHNIRVRGEDEKPGETADSKDNKPAPTQGVLVQ